MWMGVHARRRRAARERAWLDMAWPAAAGCASTEWNGHITDTCSGEAADYLVRMVNGNDDPVIRLAG